MKLICINFQKYGVIPHLCNASMELLEENFGESAISRKVVIQEFMIKSLWINFCLDILSFYSIIVDYTLKTVEIKHINSGSYTDCWMSESTLFFTKQESWLLEFLDPPLCQY